MARESMTYGELRKQLTESDARWMPDPSIADEQMIPEFGIDAEPGDPAGEPIAPDGVLEFLRKGPPPSNPDLLAVWREEGLAGKQPPKRD